MHEGLRQQHDLLVEFAQAALDHLLDHGRGLARFLRLLGEHRALALDERRIEAVDVDGLRIGGGDVHGDLLAEALQRLGVARRFERDDDADLAEPGRDAVVHVARDRAVLDGEIGAPPERHVLADRADHLLQMIGDA